MVVELTIKLYTRIKSQTKDFTIEVLVYLYNIQQ